MLNEQLTCSSRVQHSLTTGFQLLTGGPEAFDALVQFGEEGFDFGDDSVLLVTGRNLCKENIAFTKWGIAFLHLSKSSGSADFDAAGFDLDCGHGNE